MAGGPAPPGRSTKTLTKTLASRDETAGARDARAPAEGAKELAAGDRVGVCRIVRKIGAMVFIAAAVALAWRMSRAPAPCAGDAPFLAGLWDDGGRAALREAFLRTGRGHAAHTFDLVAARLDGYARAWLAARTSACEATRVRGEQSARLLSLRMRCLDRQASRVASLVQALAGGTGESIDRAVVAADAATRELCRDTEALEAAVPPPDDPDRRALLAAAERRADQTRALVDSARFGDAEKLLQTLVPDARRLDQAPLLAHALFSLARLLGETGRPEDAVATYKEAARVASAAHDDRLVAETWNRLLWAVGVTLDRPDDALALAPAAEAAVARVAAEDAAAPVRLAEIRGVLYRRKGRVDDARAELERSVALAEARLAPDALELADALDSLGVLYRSTSAIARAEEAFRRALDIRARRLGPESPVAGRKPE